MDAATTDTGILTTLLPAALFSASFLVGKKLRAPENHDAKRTLVSLASGASVAYVFLHVFPALEEMRALLVEHAAAAGVSTPFGGKVVYVSAMVGFFLFYGLERAMVRAGEVSHGHGPEGESQGCVLRRIQLGGFGLYAWLISYYLVRGHHRGGVAIALYTGAMLLHYLSLGYNLRREHGPSYDRGPAWFLAAASLGGWLCGVLVTIPTFLLLSCVALVAGALIVNTLITELSEGEGRFPPLVAGGLGYAFLLLLGH